MFVKFRTGIRGGQKSYCLFAHCNFGQKEGKMRDSIHKQHLVCGEKDLQPKAEKEGDQPGVTVLKILENHLSLSNDFLIYRRHSSVNAW